ncbi:MAG: hypothetical protein QY326_01980 [Bdellovibrionota bacterium]|nr:MAG: hypothetical protein QY326_01980 [Bdellovibrionota bacterium]
MDIYRFFHPHHNPRLHNTHLRQQELCELEQAASELRKALERAQARTRRAPTPPIMPEHFTDVLKAIRFVEASLQTICDAHPGDSEAELAQVVSERSELSGWESWTSLIREQLVSSRQEVAAASNDHHKVEQDTIPAPPRLKIAG